MQRVPIIANIYGYSVCLISVVVFFIGTAMFVGGAFNVIHPTPHGVFVMRDMHFGGAMHPAPGSGMMPPKSIGTPMMGHRSMAIHPSVGRFVANARYVALRRMLVSLVMLVLAGVLFARHWRWLNGEPSTP